MYECDKVKSETNKIKHGIDFETAINLWSDNDRIIIPAKTTGEQRFLLAAKLNKTFWSAVYTHRKDKIRIISVRKSRKNEKDLYNSL
jgi:uncharacterized protein